MTQAELERKIAAIEHDARLLKARVYKEYAISNAKYKIGDILGDYSGFIRVERIGYSMFRENVSIYYSGTVLTKKLEPRKDGTKRKIFQSMVKLVK